MKVLKEVDLLENFRNSSYHFFSTFFYPSLFSWGGGEEGGRWEERMGEVQEWGYQEVIVLLLLVLFLVADQLNLFEFFHWSIFLFISFIFL